MAAKSTKNVAFKPNRVYIARYPLSTIRLQGAVFDMPLMTQIRNNMAKLFAAFAVLFIAYIMLDWGMDLTSLNPGRGDDTVGKVNGQKISYKDFSELLRRASESQKSQTGKDPDDETERQIRTQVWNTLVTQILIDGEIERLGIVVTDKEIIDLVHGPTPPEQLMNMFRDSTGRFNRSAYDRAIADPQNRTAWLQIEQQLRQQLLQQKLQSILFATVRVGEAELRQRFADQTITMEGEYVLFDPQRLVPDSMVIIAEAELEKYYGSHQDEFKVRPARKLKYVFFSNAPSRQDSADVYGEIQRLREQALSGSDFLDLAKTYSEIPATEAFYKHGELSSRKESAVFASKKGEIVGPVLDDDGYHLLKVVDERKGTEEYVHASHILFQPTGSDTASVVKQAREVLREIRGGADFAEKARQFGSDGTAPLGGELGWGSRKTWVKPFSDEAFRGRPGEILGPVRTQFGWHIIKVNARDHRELKLIDLNLQIRSSSQSADAMFQRAEDFVYLTKSEGFEKAAENSIFQVRETPEFSKGGMIPGIGLNDAVTNFAFNGDVDAVSDPISVSGGMAVCKISFVREEGVRPLDEVKNVVRSAVLRAKKMERAKEKALEFSKGLSPSFDLLTAASGLRNVVAQRTGPFKATDSPIGVGRDLAFIGVATTLGTGEFSHPFEGARGVYIIKLTQKMPFDSTTFSVQRASLRDQIFQEKRNSFSNEWLSSLREKADIEDNRDRFYR